ncbi:retrotransposon-derived PEG10 [Labeo rohita]|uniref:Retrotransposon-derived PEG10 n=1 Tax=Labeo rohita TaxID=84645 RepID=A0A498NYA9_LABRO|nr:retrotransposon-derived PEG10 [Labeo rohita]
MIDSGAALNIIDRTIVEKYQIPTQTCTPPIKIKAINDTLIGEGITHQTRTLTLKVGLLHQESITFYIVDSPKHDAVLGFPWLSTHDPDISWYHGQTIPEACTLISEQETVIPAYTKGVAVRLNLRCGQTLSHSLGFFQPSPECVELGLTLEATPLVEVTSRALYILFNNCMAMDVRVPKAYRLGWLVSYDFQDFELVLPVIGPLPVSMIPEGSSSHTVVTVPFKIITILSVVPVVKEQVCRTELTVDQHLAVYTVSSHPTCETDNATAPPTVHQTDDVKTGEPYPGFETQVQQILKDADALREDADRHKLRQVLYKYKDSFAKDSLDLQDSSRIV